jgi:uncharacterized membrane protein YciS (DUF1049 family)
MKRTIVMAFLLASLFVAGHASAQDHVVKADIPFDFTAGGKLLPSGTYLLSSSIGMSHVIQIRNPQGSVAVFSGAYDSGTESKTSRLIFNRYGDQYFLSEVLCSSAHMNVQIPTSKLEKRVRSQEAQLRSDNQTFVALK